MERTKHTGVYRRGEVYVAVVGFRDGRGRRKQRWVTAPTLAGALTARRRLQGQIDGGLRPDGSVATVREFADIWLQEATDRLRPLTIANYRSALDRHILPALGDLKLRDVGRSHLRSLYAGLTPSVASRAHAVLSSMFSAAVKDHGILSANPCSSVRRPRYAVAEASHLEPPEARRLLDAAQGHPLEPAVVLGLTAGLRVAEALVARWGDLDPDGVLTIARSYWGPTKSGRVRSLTLPSGALARLRRIHRETAEALLALGVRLGSDSPIVGDALGRPFPMQSFRAAWGRFTCESGFDRLVFHSLRDSHAIALLTAGVDVRTAAGRLGHADASMILRVYGHYVRSADREAAVRLETVLS